MKVLLIADDEPRFRRYLSGFGKYLDEEVGIKDTVSLRAGKPEDQTKMIRLVTLLSPNPLLLVYSGHGNGKGWNQSFDYRTLCLFFSQSPNQIFLLDSSCHSGAILPIVESSELSPQRFGVITSSLESEKSYGNEFLRELTKCWRSHHVYDPEEYALTLERGGDYSVRQETIRTEQRDGWTIEYVVLDPVLETPVEAIEHFCPRWGFIFDGLLFPRKNLG